MQHKKYKLLNRWAHYVQSSEGIDTLGLNLDRAFEFNSANERYERLNADDGFEEFDERDKPHPTTK
jgi:hypothetical protein